ncbi:hypothetical protein PAAG_11333 [Paracoccidioides lutzii Pb01]|uniref:Uncharacterized protein n=1 Tax=Paracoccidioides lutzii (strain ATCC MYA-826 / Pb01) TaxID=502779 RepID=A0A0A2V6F8_PARBA|nr:hypothetical protein PAAG_11333 [Paracoccidioides lutzii Pb01]KGQ01942.1 hypothetical protein PAAG_11333 [Paracoccidioides lutzii Pb01]
MARATIPSSQILCPLRRTLFLQLAQRIANHMDNCATFGTGKTFATTYRNCADDGFPASSSTPTIGIADGNTPKKVLSTIVDKKAPAPMIASGIRLSANHSQFNVSRLAVICAFFQTEHVCSDTYERCIKSPTATKSPGTFPCQIAECPRLTKPFSRLWNLQNHMKIHGRRNEGLPETSAMSPVERTKRRRSGRDIRLDDVRCISLDSLDSKGSPQSLQSRLESLVKQKGELDEKIRALENAQRIVEGMDCKKG